MKAAVIAGLMFASTLAFAADQSARCEILARSVIGHGIGGVPQVSNLGQIEVDCHIEARPGPPKDWPADQPWPYFGIMNMKITQGGYGLTVDAKAFEIAADRTEKPVPAQVNLSGAGGDSDKNEEMVSFSLKLPLDPADQLAEVQRTFRNWERLTEERGDEDSSEMKEALRKFESDPAKVALMATQHRAGRFRVELHVKDKDQGTVVGTGELLLEVVFKGRLSDSSEPPATRPTADAAR